MNIIEFLEDNDISVTKFLDYMENELDEPQQNILITEFLETSNKTAYTSDYTQPSHHTDYTRPSHHTDYTRPDYSVDYTNGFLQ